MEKYIGIKTISGFLVIISGTLLVIQTIAIIIGFIIGDYDFIDRRFEYLLNIAGVIIGCGTILVLGGKLSNINGNGYKNENKI